jgi:hypothetical protein
MRSRPVVSVRALHGRTYQCVSQLARKRPNLTASSGPPPLGPSRAARWPKGGSLSRRMHGSVLFLVGLIVP